MPLVNKTFSEIITFTRATSATYFDATGTLQSAGNDVPRFDYDPSTLAPRGFLIEEQRTNQARAGDAMYITQQLTVTGGAGTFTDGETVNATGGGSGVYVAAQSSTSIFSISGGSGVFTGTLTGVTSGATRTISAAANMFTVGGNLTNSSVSVANPFGASKVAQISTTAVGSGYTDYVTSVVSGTTYTFSFYAKPATTNICTILLLGSSFNSGGSNVAMDFNVNTGAVTTTAGAVAASAYGTQNIGGGWYRCWLTQTATTTASVNVQFVRLASASQSLYFHAAQIEAGAFPTSYIPTTTATVTRAPDVASVNTLSPWYNANAGTLYAEFNIPYALGSGAGLRVADLQGAGGALVDETMIFVSQSSGKAASGTSINAGVNAGRMDVSAAFSANTIVKSAFAFTSGDRAITSGGASPTTSAAAFTLPTMTIFRLGSQDGIGTSALNGWLRRISYYPRRLTNAELQTLTT